MFKLLCVLAVLVAVVAAMPSAPAAGNDPAPDGIVVRDAAPASDALLTDNTEDGPAGEGTLDAQDDMDKAETFGYGYRKVIHVYPRYYPHYYGGYYPRYHYGHYGHYW